MNTDKISANNYTYKCIVWPYLTKCEINCYLSSSLGNKKKPLDVTNLKRKMSEGKSKT